MKSAGYIHLLLLLFLLSCGETSQVKETIRQAADNRYELEKVLRFYEVSPTDSLKLKAARFLIGNMQNKGFLEGGEMVLYRMVFDSISRRHDLDSCDPSKDDKNNNTSGLDHYIYYDGTMYNY